VHARALPIFAALSVAACVAFALALAAGSVHVPLAGLWTALTGGDAGMHGDIVLKLRMPRALAAFGVGALLALSGALLQVLLRNPLAEPYLMGISGGAAVGALSMLLLGAAVWLVHAAAIVGAALAVLLVLSLARHDFAQGAGHDGSPRLLLTGVIVAAGCGAVVTLILAIAPDQKLRGMLFWLMGDFNGVDRWQLPLGGALVLLLLMLPEARALNAMARGPLAAQTLGVDVRTQRMRLYAVASLATAFAVTTAGAVGFIGLIVPHAMRLIIGNDQRGLLPVSAVAGGTLLLLADTLARTVVAPVQLPVGVVMAFVGVPSFLYLLLRRHEHA
jgi:iron complex transport system permease protein